MTSLINCIICNNESHFFLRKKYEDPYDCLLEESNFYKCSHCGFTFSDTLFKMSRENWSKLNFDFHMMLENDKKEINQPPYVEQSLMLRILSKNKVIDGKDILDYAGGLGTLAKCLMKYFNINIEIYDPYVKDSGGVSYVSIDNLKKKNVVFNSALFEHIRSRDDLDFIDSLVASCGVLIIHTVICENIPKNANWFYITPPVHSSLHTNKSMNILMKQWGYKASLYCPSAKSWVLFKEIDGKLQNKINEINLELQTDYLIFKEGFVDYWKGF